MTKKTDKKVKIIGTGMYVPDRVLTNADLEKMVDTTDEWIMTRTGIRERRIAAKDQATSDLGIIAARRALKSAHLEPQDIDVIIVATHTPDHPFPATACLIQAGIKAGLVPAFDLIGGCTGFLYGLIVAEGLILSGAVRRALVIGAEMLSRITNWEDRNTCVLFGDGAGAVVLEESKDDSGILSHFWQADGNLGPLLILPAGGSRLPACHDTVAKRQHTLHMKGNEVFKHAVKRMAEAGEEALKRAGLKKDAVDWLIPHQANMRIIEATGERLGIPREKVFVNINRYGNVSVACIPMALDEMSRAGQLKKGHVVLLDAFGAGFTWAAAALRW
jgi:3-oxoacyl-[acyl-carrier-protein] synthase-3